MQPTPLQLQTALIEAWSQKILPARSIAATLTFRPRFEGRRLTEREGQQAVRHFLRLLDGEAFGKRAIRGQAKLRHQLQRVVVREGGFGACDKTLHYHLQLETPVGVPRSDWRRVAERSWSRVGWASLLQNRFLDVEDEGWFHYMLKLRDKPNFIDAVDFENCWVG